MLLVLPACVIQLDVGMLVGRQLPIYLSDAPRAAGQIGNGVAVISL